MSTEAKFYRTIDRVEMTCLNCYWTATTTDSAAPAVEHTSRESHHVQVTTTAVIRPAAYRKKIEVETMGAIR